MAKFATHIGDPHGDPQASPQHADPHGFLVWFYLKGPKSMWIGVLWAGLRAAMWITHVRGKFRHGLLGKSLNFARLNSQASICPLSKKLLWIFYSNLPGNFALKNGGDFWWIFSGLRFPQNEARKLLEKFGKIRSKIRGKIRDESPKNSGKIRSAAFLTKPSLWKGMCCRGQTRPLQCSALCVCESLWLLPG